MDQQGGTDVLWLVFSLLTQERTRQVAILNGLPPASEADMSALTENAAVYLLGAVDRFSESWIEEFDPCPIARQFFALAASMAGPQSLDKFLSDEKWEELRRLARLVLAEAGLDPTPVPDRIDFGNYMEIVRSEDIAAYIDKTATERDEIAWRGAAKSFTRNVNATVLCPACKAGSLRLTQSLTEPGPGKEKKMVCAACGSWRLLPDAPAGHMR